MNINGVNSNSFENQSEKNINISKKKDEFSKEINYHKTNQPMEFIGRSMISFKGSKRTFNKILKEAINKGVIDEEEIASLSKEDIEAKLNFYTQYKSIKPEVICTYLKCVNAQTANFMEILFSSDIFSRIKNDEYVADDISMFLLKDFDKSTNDIQSNIDKKLEMIEFLKDKKGIDEEIAFYTPIITNVQNYKLIETLINDNLLNEKTLYSLIDMANRDNPELSIEQKESLYQKRLELYQQEKDNRILGIETILNVIARMDDDNIAVAQNEISTIMDFVKWADEHSYIPDEDKRNEVKKYVTPATTDFVKDLVKDNIVPIDKYRYIIRTEKTQREQDLLKSKMEFYYKYRNIPEPSCNEIADILLNVSPETIDYICMLMDDETFPDNLVKVASASFYNNDTEKTITAKNEIYSLLKNEASIEKESLARILGQISETNMNFIIKLAKDEDFPKSEISYFVYEGLRTENDAYSVKEKVYDILKSTKKCDGNVISTAMSTVNDNTKEFVLTLCKDPKFPASAIKNVCYSIGIDKNDNYAAKEEILNLINAERQDFSGEEIANVLKSVSVKNVDIARKCVKNKIISSKNISDILERILYSFNDSDNSRCIDKIDVIDAFQKRSNVDIEKANKILQMIYPYNAKLAVLMAEDENFPQDKIPDILKYTNTHEKEIFYSKLKEMNLTANDNLPDLLNSLNKTNVNFAMRLLGIANYETILTIIKDSSITEEEVINFINKVGKEKIAQFGAGTDIITAIQFSDLYQKNDINEIPLSMKKDLLRKLVSSNTDLFSNSDILKQYFPILPKNVEEYCTVLPAIVRSLGIETNDLSEKQTKDFNTNLSKLGDVLYSIKDEEFNAITIEQTYSREKFIQDTLNITNGLSENEKQKVFDYFGFELEPNKTNPTGYSIKGYPVNLNNGKKLAKITNSKTKQTVEELRKNVIEFSEHNPIKCSNKNIEPLLNEIVSVLPELRPQIGKLQAGMTGTSIGSHEFDVFKHSLKVMQKIVQDKNFATLGESDKKVMLIAALLHDITKKEGYTDVTHTKESAFDAFFITNKFNITKEEKIKLHTIIANHEWLAYINSSRNDEELHNRMQSVAYDLRHDNLFDMSLMFTHADLRAIKQNDSFHDNRNGKGRKEINGEIRSFGEAADIYAGTKNDDLKSNTVRGYINELKKSQPVLPVTKFPTASKINEAITTIYPDGSTNIKGIYKDGDLVIIKYNEVENWEEIGFPKGSISEGIHNTNESTKEDINTGNIKFFIHGLDYPNQLIKFDAFSLVDSDALLSVSYAERPESKYRFFRAQGVILDVDTKYIHGGGKTDAGSGCGKFIETFKNRYLFDGDRFSDRLYISDMIKECTGMNDTEYLKFVKENENKSFSEIEPKELQETIIKAFSNINSNTRTGNRAYNEMYISNPKQPMGVFAYNYDKDGEIGNPVNFLRKEKTNNIEKLSVKERTGFLKDYAIEHDIPFVVFGD